MSECECNKAKDSEFCDFEVSPGVGHVDLVEKQRASCFLKRLEDQSDTEESRFSQSSEDKTQDFGE